MKKRIFSTIIAFFLAFTFEAHVWGDVEDEIEYAREQKADAEASLAAAQANLYSLESKKQELEGYLSQLNAQYTELNQAIEDLDAQTKQKEEELISVKAELKAAQIEEKQQYEAMKIRIQYMFEHGGDNALVTLFSAKSFADFLNQAENVKALTAYDRDMLKKYEETCAAVEEKETAVNQEIDELSALLTEKTEKQQEVQSLVSATNENIQSYVSQISASEAEASYLMEQVNSAESSIYDLMIRAQEERAAAEAAAHEETSGYSDSDAGGEYGETSYYNEDTYSDEDSCYGEDTSYDEDSYDEDSYNENSYYENSYDEDSYEDSYYDEDSSYDDSSYYEESGSSSSGTYLGTFKLTGYCNCASCCGTAGNATASGVYPTSYHTVAMAGVPFGTQLLINGTVYTVEDLGTPYGHVDIYFDSHSEALNFGLQYADVYQLN